MESSHETSDGKRESRYHLAPQKKNKEAFTHAQRAYQGG